MDTIKTPNTIKYPPIKDDAMIINSQTPALFTSCLIKTIWVIGIDVV